MTPDKSQRSTAESSAKSASWEPGRVAGLVMCGGKSQRMGEDKALLRMGEGGPTLLETAVEALSAVTGEILLSTSSPEPYAFLGIRSVPDAFVGIGPLGGLIAGLEALARAEWVLVCACDLPFVTPRFLRSLLARARESAGAQVVMPTTISGDEPLVAAYRPAAAQELRRAAASGVRRIAPISGGANAGGRNCDFALAGLVVERVQLHELDLGEAGAPAASLALLNVNDPIQLRQASRFRPETQLSR